VAEAEVLFTGVGYKSFADDDRALKIRTAFATALHADLDAVSFSRVVPGTSEGEKDRTSMVKVQILSPSLPGAEHMQAALNVLLGNSQAFNAALEKETLLKDAGVNLVLSPTVHALHTFETEISAVAALTSHREEVTLGKTSENHCEDVLALELPGMKDAKAMSGWCYSMFRHRGLIEAAGEAAIQNVCSMLSNAFESSKKESRTSRRLCQVLHDGVSLYIDGDPKSANGSVFPSPSESGDDDALKQHESGDEDVLKEHFELLGEGHAAETSKLMASAERVRKTCKAHPEIAKCGMDPCVPHLLPGCDDPVIQDCVCKQQSYCCNGEWDWTCVQTISLQGCSDKCKDVESKTVRYDEEPTLDLLLNGAAKALSS